MKKFGPCARITRDNDLHGIKIKWQYCPKQRSRQKLRKRRGRVGSRLHHQKRVYSWLHDPHSSRLINYKTKTVWFEWKKRTITKNEDVRRCEQRTRVCFGRSGNASVSISGLLWLAGAADGFWCASKATFPIPWCGDWGITFIRVICSNQFPPCFIVILAKCLPCMMNGV